MKARSLGNSVRQIVEQIVELAHPLRIVLFGSAARGKTGPDSDLDFLVVVSGRQRAEDVTDRLNTGIRQRPMPCDFVVVTESALKKHGNTPGLVYAEILKRGRVVYAG